MVQALLMKINEYGCGAFYRSIDEDLTCYKKELSVFNIIE